MKMIEAVIDQLRLQEVRFALDDIGVVDFMVTPILCHGDGAKQVITYRGLNLVANVVHKVKVEIVSADDSVAKITKVIRSVFKVGEECRIGILPYLEIV